VIDRNDAFALGDQPFDDLRQFGDCNALDDLFSRRGVRTGAAADVDCDGVDDLAVNRRAMPAEADVRRLVIAAARLAPGPMHRQRRAARSEARFERLRQRERGPIGVNQREIAEISADARHQTTYERRCGDGESR
jgi:hypothetical protein